MPLQLQKCNMGALLNSDAATKKHVIQVVTVYLDQR